MKESIIYFSVRAFGALIRLLPLAVALGIGEFIGILAYYFDIRHRSQAYANIHMAFAHEKTPQEIKRITKGVFKSYGKNLVELFRLPLLNATNYEKYVTIDGKENINEALRQGNGGILLAMHFGSWEMASLSCAIMKVPYKIFVKPQSKYSKLDELLNSYRSFGGSVVLSRGSGTRDFVKSLKNNEIIGMVVDQGGRDGALVPFFDRQAAMSVGAIRMGLKFNVPICFSVIIREDRSHHRIIIQKPLELIKTGDIEKDISTNLRNVSKIMEGYIRRYPHEYMWFYKIWKYSKEAKIIILSDGKAGHEHQSMKVAQMIQKALQERMIESTIDTMTVKYKGKIAAKVFSVLSVLVPMFFSRLRHLLIRLFTTKETYQSMVTSKADFIISCGSSIAAANYMLAKDQMAKSICVLKPGLHAIKKFDLVVLPLHDNLQKLRPQEHICSVQLAPNIISEEYLSKNKELLLNRFSHLKAKCKQNIGLLIGGDSKNITLSENLIRILLRQLKDVAREVNVDILATTSRRTSRSVEQEVLKQLKGFSNSPLVIIPNNEDIPESFGGILGLADILVVSGDSISMVSEAVSSKKTTVVFYPEFAAGEKSKHQRFIDNLNEQGYIVATDVKNLSGILLDVLKGKITTRSVQDDDALLAAVRNVI